MESSKIKVLMVGPDRGVHGGISAIVNNYYEAGLDKRVDLKYIGTMKEGSRGKKLLVAAAAYFKFLCSLSWCDVVHVNASSDSSIMRKSFFIKAAYRHNKKIVLHQHGGDFKNYFENQKIFFFFLNFLFLIYYILHYKDFYYYLNQEYHFY